MSYCAVIGVCISIVHGVSLSKCTAVQLYVVRSLICPPRIERMLHVALTFQSYM